jgi:hypothetical protein
VSGYASDVRRTFEGEVYSVNPVPGVRRVQFAQPVRNSGVLAIALAHRFGAARITLAGYDCQHTGGKTHWHGDHPRGMGNAGSISGTKMAPKWAEQFAQLANTVRDIPVVNASRATALACFPRAELQACLQG